mmetsp:Transcript_35801/g.93323  ORF Transcript_35801/g.93323 Transcript_35801/m.93323 type:complete len:105 (+) Transcript_35801:1175-1489(+)
MHVICTRSLSYLSPACYHHAYTAYRLHVAHSYTHSIWFVAILLTCIPICLLLSFLRMHVCMCLHVPACVCVRAFVYTCMCIRACSCSALIIVINVESEKDKEKW